MGIELKMPALSPTMEEGTLAKWLVKEGDTVVSGDILAEIETDKATMEFEAVDEGTIARILVPEGTDEVKVGTVIALIAEGEDASQRKAPAAAKEVGTAGRRTGRRAPASAPAPPAPTPQPAAAAPAKSDGERIKASPLAAACRRRDGRPAWPARVPGGESSRRISRRRPARRRRVELEAPRRRTRPRSRPGPGRGEILHEVVKLSNMRKTIARRLTRPVTADPHIYLTVDVQLDALLKLRAS
jgi:pyruvate dehydrogenase E2 component (dihydrolipoamide acetyltransferase)